MRGRVLVLDSPYSAEPVEERELAGYDVERARTADVDAPRADVVGVVVDMSPVDAALLDRLPALRCVSVTGVGLDSIDLAACRARGVTVVNVPAGATEEVATHAVALLLALARRLRPYHEHVAGGGFRFDGSGSVRRLSELTVGIVGLGRIGRAVADRLAPFGCGLLGWNIVPVEHPPVRSVALDELCARSDAVTIHVALTGQTVDLFGRARLESLRPGALVVNTSRGNVLDTHALIDLLRSGRLGGAALDVFRREPPGTDELALAHAGANVVLTPHAAFWSAESEAAIRREACANLRRVLEG